METLQVIQHVFNNQSVGAFIGAFAAFALVVLNDWRRDRRKVANLRGEIEMNLGHAKAKLETVRRNRNALRHESRVVPAPLLKFNTVLIRQLAAEVLARLRLDQRRALEAICYAMDATDSILEEAYTLTRSFTQAHGRVEPFAVTRLGDEYDDAIANLKRLSEMCENYIAGRYAVITEKEYDRAAYEGP